MKIETHAIERRRIEDFADEHGLVMTLSSVNGSSRWYAHFADTEISTADGVCLSSASGSGKTPLRAIADYAKVISGQTLVVNAMNQAKRRVIEAPVFEPYPTEPTAEHEMSNEETQEERENAADDAHRLAYEVWQGKHRALAEAEAALYHAKAEELLARTERDRLHDEWVQLML